MMIWKKNMIWGEHKGWRDSEASLSHTSVYRKKKILENVFNANLKNCEVYLFLPPPQSIPSAASGEVEMKQK